MWVRLKTVFSAAGAPAQPPFYSLRSPDGSFTGLADQMTVDYLVSQMPDPSQAMLDVLLATITCVRVKEDGVADGKAISDNILLDERNPQAITALRGCLAIDEAAPAGHCMCLGDYAIELYSGDQLAATLGLHHGRSIRWETTWSHDAMLQNGLKLLWWLSTRGISAPLAKFEAERTRAHAARLAAERWRAAMPAYLQPHWEQIRRNEVEPTTLHFALIKAIPDPIARIQTLMSWFGCGAEPWSGYPSYEQAAEELLLLEETPIVIRVLEIEPLTPSQLAGAARYFASWHFREHRSHELRLVPERLKAQFLAQAWPRPAPTSASARCSPSAQHKPNNCAVLRGMATSRLHSSAYISYSCYYSHYIIY
jgi:hypothetical protein